MTELYDEVGGPDGVRTAVAMLYRRVVADEELGPWFRDVDLDRLRSHQRAFLSAAFGGPQVFSGRSLAEAHEGLEITDAAFDRIVQTLPTTAAGWPLICTLSMQPSCNLPTKLDVCGTTEPSGLVTWCMSVALIKSPAFAAGFPIIFPYVGATLVVALDWAGTRPTPTVS
jgi:hemoglobin